VLAQRVQRGHVLDAAPDISYIPRAPNYVGVPFRPTHSGPWGYLSNVPLVLYGPSFVEPRGDVDTPATMADVAPTIARIVRFGGWPDRGGRALTDGLTGTRPPRLVVTIVWDGGGSNVLARHREQWPFLASLMRRGVSYTRMTVGSSPSVTPPVHATLGTGSWPAQHGIHAIQQRLTDGSFGDPLLNLDPSAIRVPTLADLYDRKRGNEPVTGMLASSNWHLGMIGHGAQLDGGDHDPVVLIDEDGFTFSNESIYSLPEIGNRSFLMRLVDHLDRSDGKADGAWNGDDLSGGESVEDILTKKGNPARVKYEQRLLEQLIRSEDLGADTVPDLLFVNFKAADEAGHRWGMSSQQVGAVIAEQDRALRKLVGLLDGLVGRDQWILIVTADHGQTPLPDESGAWVVSANELINDANREFDDSDNGRALVTRALPTGLYLDDQERVSNAVSKQAIARWLASYTVGDNATTPPRGRWNGREDEDVFDAVLVGSTPVYRAC
jgi:Type I phosphodiesterase / nucleotide pyrophosphatase